MMQRTTTFVAYSRADIERKIDRFLSEGRAYKPRDLIMPVSGATRFDYRGFSVREWHHQGNVRFDAAVELL